MANRVYIDERFAWAITIGAHTRIAHDVRIIAHDAATKHLTGYTEVRPVVIGEYCYIGAGVLVLPGATIGTGAVIGAGAIVRGDIPGGTVATGSPAKVVRQAEELQARHIEMQNTVPVFDRHPIDMNNVEQAQMREELAKTSHLYVR